MNIAAKVTHKFYMIIMYSFSDLRTGSGGAQKLGSTTSRRVKEKSREDNDKGKEYKRSVQRGRSHISTNPCRSKSRPRLLRKDW